MYLPYPKKLVSSNTHASRQRGKVSERAMKGEKRVETEKRAKRFRLRRGGLLFMRWMVAGSCHA